MLKQEENELVTRVGPGTPMGNRMRRYWMPALLASELPAPDCDPVRVRLLGENLIALPRHATAQSAWSPRTARIAAPRCSSDATKSPACAASITAGSSTPTGQCIDMPNEPAESRLQDQGPGSGVPDRREGRRRLDVHGPAREAAALPEPGVDARARGPRYVSKTYQNCNYLQAMEGGLDTSHSSFLHRDLDRAGLANPRVRSTAPRLEVLQHRLRLHVRQHSPTARREAELRAHLPLRHAVLSTARGRLARTVGNTDGHIWVPIDDSTCRTWNFHLQPCRRRMTSSDCNRWSTSWAAASPRTTSPGRSSSRPTRATTTASAANDRRRSTTPASRAPIPRTSPSRRAWARSTTAPRSISGSADTAIIQMRRLLIQASQDVQKAAIRSARRRGQHVRPAQMYLPEDARWTETRLKDALVAQY